MARRKKTATSGRTAAEAVTSIQYSATRKNIPLAGLESHGRVREAPPLQYQYNPHLPPVLRSAPDAAATDRLSELLAEARHRPLSEEEAGTLEEALKRHEPWIEWSGKRERPWFEVDPVALHMHERVSTQAILRTVAREDVQRDLFADPQQDYAKAVQFYRHDVDWANRMILGDSLQVMASLARREDLAGKVQMIYLDPPYGIRFASNFQPQLGQREVKDREQDLTREPEMVKAYRDTWTLGIHSYLAYLRDRLAMARELLADTGSIFVQIGDENLHRVRCVMDEVFGSSNFVVTVIFKKKGVTTSTASINDYLLWYAKDRNRIKIVSLLSERSEPEDDPKFNTLVSPSGEHRRTTSLNDSQCSELLWQGWRWARVNFPVVSQHWHEVRSMDYPFQGKTKNCGSNRQWSFDVPKDLDRLAKSERLFDGGGASLGGIVLWEDRVSTSLSNFWTDTKGEEKPVYAVQTAWKVVQRCMLMTTDPGDLVLDPTCGSGTTAYVAEQWGRRWITIDTSRVALSLTKHRLMTAKFDYYRLRELSADDVARNPGGIWISETGPEGRPSGGPMTFQCKVVPHITLRSIARNVSLDPIFAKHDPILAEKLAAVNRELVYADDELKGVLVEKLIAKHRQEGTAAVTGADIRRWLLPGSHPGWIKAVAARGRFKGVTARQAERYRAKIPQGEWKEWEVPFDADPDWPASLREALTAYRAASGLIFVRDSSNGIKELHLYVSRPPNRKIRPDKSSGINTLYEHGAGSRQEQRSALRAAWRAKMDEVNDCIAANAPSEELVDKPEIVRDTVRVAGPFTVEGVIAVEDGPDSPIGGAPEELEVFEADDGGERAVANAEAHLDKIIRLLKASGMDFPGNSNMRFSRLEPVTGAALIHAEGEWMNDAGGERRVAVSIGPEVGNVTSMQVEDVIRSANRSGYDDVAFAGFGFDAAAQEAIESGSHPNLRLHMALIRPDVAMDDLLKTQPGSQLFTVFAAPRVRGPRRLETGDHVVGVQGMDVYDPVSGTLHPTDRQHIAAWFVDTDYDGRTFCICQAFFPDRSKWDRLARALGDKGVVERERFDLLSGFESLPFSRPSRLVEGESWRVAVKAIDPRGNEGLRVLTVWG